MISEMELLTPVRGGDISHSILHARGGLYFMIYLDVYGPGCCDMGIAIEKRRKEPQAV